MGVSMQVMGTCISSSVMSLAAGKPAGTGLVGLTYGGEGQSMDRVEGGHTVKLERMHPGDSRGVVSTACLQDGGFCQMELEVLCGGAGRDCFPKCVCLCGGKGESTLSWLPFPSNWRSAPRWAMAPQALSTGQRSRMNQVIQS